MRRQTWAYYFLLLGLSVAYFGIWFGVPFAVIVSLIWIGMGIRIAQESTTELTPKSKYPADWICPQCGFEINLDCLCDIPPWEELDAEDSNPYST